MLVKRKTVSSRLCEPWKENGSMYARFYLFFGSIQSVLGFGVDSERLYAVWSRNKFPKQMISNNYRNSTK